MSENGIGQRIPPKENRRFVQGRGRYTDDITLPRQAYLYVLRSPHAAALITRIDTTSAKAAPGVLDVLTGADAAADGLGHFISIIPRKLPDGRPHVQPPFPVLAQDRVAHAGFPVVAVIAESLAAARDAAELIDIEYEPLPSVTRTAQLLQSGAPAVWPQAPDNICFVHELGNREAVDLAFAKAAHVATVDLVITRVSANPLENRNAIGVYDERDGRYTLYSGHQMPHALRSELANAVLKIPADRLRVISPDIGGAFGMKTAAAPEAALALWCARRVGRPVRWQADRSEALLSDWHARDILSHVELALDREGHFLALRVASVANLGAYLCSITLHSPTNNLGSLAGPYRTPHIHTVVTGAFSNSNPTAPYRGAGRPEASYAVERVIDVAAREMGIDRVELRRRNLIPPEAMPFKTGLVFTYDSGEFERNMDNALAMADWAGFEARRAEAQRRGKLRGIGLANVIEIAGGPAGAPMEESAEVRIDASGKALVQIGLHSHGQGLETVLGQVLTETLGLPPEHIRVIYGDTDQIYHGQGTAGSRSAIVGSTVLTKVSAKIVEKGKQIAAHVLEASPLDIEFEKGHFRVAGTDKALPLSDVAKAAFTAARLPPGMEMGLNASTIAAANDATFPNGSHICEVEIDPETGTLTTVGYWIVDDVGRIINPLVVEGQIQGGVAQGLGQALLEQIVYDPDTGQLLSGSFTDYAMPRATDVPSTVATFNEVLARNNPWGVKGAGEAGTVGALPAIMNAVNDALAPLGVRSFDMPATPARLWHVIRDANQKI